ncbi:MAG TPA: hypothetical protein VF045_01775 [Acidimicrobiales bacterium]
MAVERRWGALARGRTGRAAVAALVLCGVMAACGGDGDDEARTRAEPTAGSWTPWILSSGGEIAVPAPPAKGSNKAEADLDEVKRLAEDRSPADMDMINRFSGPTPTDPWMDRLHEYIAKSEKNPPLASRNAGLVSVAMYDAAIAAYHWKYRYDIDPPSGVDRAVSISADPSYPSEHAAMAGAASRVLAYLYPNEGSLRLDEMADQAADSRVQAGANTRSDVEAGLELGRAVAEKVIAYGKADGSDKVWDGRRPAGIGVGGRFWAPPPGSVANPVEPLAGTWKTFTLSRPDQFRPPPPPAYNSPEYRASAQKLIDMKNNLTPEQAAIAKYWEGAQGSHLPAGIVNDTYIKDIREKVTSGDAAQRWTVPRVARAVALLNIVMSDGGISVWEAKYHYWYPRPVNGIRDPGIDRNWTPHLPTPLFPAYPSGSAGYAGGAEAVMSYLIPEKAELFRQRAEEQALSRQYAGIHWDFDSVSIEGGRGIGGLVVERARQDGADRPS